MRQHCRRLGSLVAAIICLGFVPRVSPANDVDTAQAAFLEVERAVRLPEAEQSAAVPKCYELAPYLIDRRYANAAFPREKINPQVTPEAAAKALLARGGWPELHGEARRKGLNLLKRHTKTLQPLVDADFASGEEARVARALAVAGELRLAASFNDVLKVFQSQSPNVQLAAYTLRDLGDPRAIQPLVAKDPAQPMQYFEILRLLCRKQPAAPALVALLDSDDAEIRWRATYALSERGDDALAPKVEKLFRDPDPRVRQAAANLAVLLSDGAIKKLRPGLLMLLKDPEREVRFYVALYLANLHDQACAPTLLALLREGQLHPGYHSTAVQAVHTLTGSYFGYELGETPSSPANQKALEGLATWVDQQGK